MWMFSASLSTSGLICFNKAIHRALAYDHAIFNTGHLILAAAEDAEANTALRISFPKLDFSKFEKVYQEVSADSLFCRESGYPVPVYLPKVGTDVLNTINKVAEIYESGATPIDLIFVACMFSGVARETFCRIGYAERMNDCISALVSFTSRVSEETVNEHRMPPRKFSYSDTKTLLSCNKSEVPFDYHNMGQYEAFSSILDDSDESEKDTLDVIHDIACGTEDLTGETEDYVEDTKQDVVEHRRTSDVDPDGLEELVEKYTSGDHEQLHNKRIGKDFEGTLPKLGVSKGVERVPKRWYIEKVIGRDEEAKTVVEALMKVDNCNALLIGEPGVGKTAVIKKALQRLRTDKNLSNELRFRPVFMLDMKEVIALSKYKGGCEDILSRALESIHRVNGIIVIDEIHRLIALGKGVAGESGVAGVLKDYITNGKVSIIAATTYSDMKSSIDDDKALKRRFSIIDVKEPNKDDTFCILKGAVKKYEDIHGVSCSDDRLKEVINLANIYVPDTKLPDKAFSIIDEAMVIAEERAEDHLTSEHIKEVISKKSGVDITDIGASDLDKLLRLEDEFGKHLIGQKDAVKKVCSAVRRGKSGICNPDKPVASFLFVGPTGVGKTELSKILSENFGPGGKDNLIRLDMSEYSESHSVSKLFGSPPGYVGYDKGGGLTERVKHKPSSVVLFDEIEKAHPNVFNSLLQILDDGNMTDSYNDTVSFRNCIIIMTSNAGYGAEGFSRAPLGFGAQMTEMTSSERELKALRALEDTFKPEFLNRIDNVIIFDKLSKEESKDIVRLQLNLLRDRLAIQGIELKDVADDILDKIVDIGYDDRYNARNLKRTIQNLIENKVADGILAGTVKRGDTAEIELDGDTILFKPVN